VSSPTLSSDWIHCNYCCYWASWFLRGSFSIFSGFTPHQVSYPFGPPSCCSVSTGKKKFHQGPRSAKKCFQFPLRYPSFHPLPNSHKQTSHSRTWLPRLQARQRSFQANQLPRLPSAFIYSLRDAHSLSSLNIINMREFEREKLCHICL
jgi:hypothetical protein